MSRQATPDAIGLHERGSATPAGKPLANQPSSSAATLRVPHGIGLRAQQEAFVRIVTTPESEPSPIDEREAARLVTPSATLSAFERLAIYRSGYHARLIECLLDDYPVLEHALGSERFESLCRAYIAEHPSHGPSLNVFGRHMADFCRRQPLEASGFAADLAALEWAIVLSIHAPTRAPLSIDDLTQVPGERWPEARLIANPSLRILCFDYPVNDYLQAYRQGAQPAIPEPQRSFVAVYRTGRSVWRLPLSPPMLTLFEALAAGVPLGEALGRVEPLVQDENPARLAERVAGWFRQGVSSGLFSAVQLES